jgi:hypothetical protein
MPVRAHAYAPCGSQGFAGAADGKKNNALMSHGPALLSQGEQRALASFLAGRLPAGQLHDELCRAREAALAAIATRAASAPADPARPVAAAALRAA